jgi:hypothetical protein
MNYKTEDIVWVNLGRPYGWWPAQVQDTEKKIRMSAQIIDDLGEDFNVNTAMDNSIVFVKYFDDDNFEWVGVKDPKRIQNYSCKSKKKFIRAGFKSLDENKKRSLGGTNLRLAQFYKDVELAEVMTDNDADVANILSLYEISENNEEVVEEQAIDQEELKSSGNSQGKKSKKSQKKDVLNEIKSGGVNKTKKKGKKGRR